jgi:hypothetical protein
MELDELQSYFSDFHKDFYGYRPRYGTRADWYDREWLIKAITTIHSDMDRMKETPEGRAQLREEGWNIIESEYV